jgi:hypothetical protein
MLIRASITNIRRLPEFGTGVRLVLIAEGVALAAGPAATGEPCMFAVFTDPCFFTATPVNTVVVCVPRATGSGKNEMVAYLL